jgi:hypothetical protein
MSNSLINNAFPDNGLPQELHGVETKVGPSGIDNDFEDSRKNLIRMMDTTMGAIRSLSVIAHQSQMPDAYDVLNKLIKTYNDQQEQLIRFYRIKESKEAQATKKPQASIQGETVDNRQQNVFVGTPADLAKVLEQIKNKHGE